MKIICPQCAFEREVPSDRLPSASVIATCPQCQHRFRISKNDLEQGDAPQCSFAHNADGDDPLPPGAVIPNHAQASPAQHDSTQQRHVESEHIAKAQTPPSYNEEEMELRQRASAAYERQAEDGSDTQDAPFALENPWESPEKEGHLAAFYQTVVRVMFAAPRFFAGLTPDSSQTRAMIFYLLVGILQICIERFWGGVLSSTLAPTAGNDPQLQKLLEMLAPQTNIFLAILMRAAIVTMEIFIAAGLYFLIFKLIAPQKASYALIFQVLAYSVAPALLCVVPVLGSVVGFVWSVACSLIGCRYAMRLTWTQAIIGLLPLYLLGVPVFLQLVHSVQSAAG